jgi:hypothetical protein
MKNLLAQQTNLSNFVKVGVTSLALTLSLLTYTRAYGQEVEVLSVPPQEAFLIEDKTATTSGKDNAASQGVTTSTDEKTLPQLHKEKNLQSFGNTANSVPTVPQASKQAKM